MEHAFLEPLLCAGTGSQLGRRHFGDSPPPPPPPRLRRSEQGETLRGPASTPPWGLRG